MMKVAIIGAGGRVGSNAAFALQCSGVVSEIVCLDVNQAMAEGEALDLLHGAPLCSDQVIRAGTYADCADMDCIVITAGLRRKPDESRLDLINRNVSLFRTILGEIKNAGLKRDAIILVVSNPVDILTQLAVEFLDLPVQQVLGLGTVLDTSRFCALIAESLGVAPTQVNALILGEHGDSMLPVWSSANIAGLPLAKFKNVTPSWMNQIFERTKKSGAEVISRKGGAGWAVGTSIRAVVDAIASDRKCIMPVSSLVNGAYGIHGTCISVPTVVGRAGVIKHVELELWPKEMSALRASAANLKSTRENIK